MNKYRAWDKEKKEMYGVYGWNEIDKEVYMCSVPESKFRDGSMHTWHQVTKKTEDVILMQSTGLKDKNGVEIFEGDVGKSKDGSDGPTRLFIVSKDKYKTGFKPFVDIEVGFCRELCEVLGNIHENPELLKEVE